MTNSRSKGARGELEFSKVCQGQGYKDARRGQQYSGIEGQDVIGLSGIHVEVKRREKLNLYDAIGQAVRDASGRGEGELPIVAHRKNNCEWLITMRAEDWFRLYQEFEADLALRAREGKS